MASPDTIGLKADSRKHGAFRISQRSGILLLAAAITVLLALSIIRSYSLGQHETMYTGVYRIREGLTIALSQMREPPLRGYIGYRSIRNYFAQHGLGFREGDASPLPSPDDLMKLLHDGPAFTKLMQAASVAPVDPTLPPVTLAGNDLGFTNYYYWAFTLFGISTASLLIFYYVLFGVSATLYFATFWRSPVALLLLMLYLIGHYVLVGYASEPYMSAVHNTRFMSAPAMLPALHLLVLLVSRTRPTPVTVTTAAAQVFLLMFYVFCRSQVAWQPLAIALVGAAMLPFGSLWGALRMGSGVLHVAWRAIRDIWPATLTVFGILGLMAYMHVAIDSKAYATEKTTHVLWHALYSSTISAEPELARLYLKGEAPYSDNVVYQAVLAYLRAHGEVPPSIAYVQDGQIYMDAVRNMGVYDQYARRVFFELVRAHPWLVLKSFVVGKPVDQIGRFRRVYTFGPGDFAFVFIGGFAAVVLSLIAGARTPTRRKITSFLPAIVIVVACAFIPVMVDPSDTIVELIVLAIMLISLAVFYLPAAAALGKAGKAAI